MYLLLNMQILKFSGSHRRQRILKRNRGKKQGQKGNYQLGPIDKDAIKKHTKMSAEVESERQEQASPNISMQSSSSERTTEDSFDPGRQPKGPYSLLKIPRYSMELIRGDVSSNLGACLANAFLLDLKHMGLLHPKLNLNDIILDKSKIDREKA